MKLLFSTFPWMRKWKHDFISDLHKTLVFSIKLLDLVY